ncbi:MAG: hypothetical protein NUV75_10445 [Gallionella sp.]|nr:hypothetical protein [Gallionella sp.]
MKRVLWFIAVTGLVLSGCGGGGGAGNPTTSNPTTNRAYVTNNGDGTISVINTTNNTVIATINVGGSPAVYSGPRFSDNKLRW